VEQGEAKRLSALLVRRLQCLLVLRGLVVTDNATCGRSQHAMMAGDVSSDAAHDGAFDAAFCIRGNSRGGDGERQCGAAQNRFHASCSVCFLFANSCLAGLFRFRPIAESARIVGTRPHGPRSRSLSKRGRIGVNGFGGAGCVTCDGRQNQRHHARNGGRNGLLTTSNQAVPWGASLRCRGRQ
jgi:hypothetical protein